MAYMCNAKVQRMNTTDKITELQERGFCILRDHFSKHLIDKCQKAFFPILADHLKTHSGQPNRGPHRHFLAMPFKPPCFTSELFFDPDVLTIIRSVMDERAVADQWGCDVPLRGSENQDAHADFQRPLFPECPDLPLPTYILVVSFGLTKITGAHGPIEIAPGSHRIPRNEALCGVQSAKIAMQSVPLDVGDHKCPN